MSWRSVRIRLTGLVVLVAALAMFLAATIGVSRIRDSLVDDVLTDTATETLFLDGVIFEGESFEESGIGDEIDPDDDFFVDDFLAAEFPFILMELEDLADQLDRLGALDPLLAEMGRNRSDGLAVLHSFGVVAIVGLDGNPSMILDVEPIDFGERVAFEFNLYDIVNVIFERDAAEFFEAASESSFLDEPFFDEELFEELTDQRFAEAAASTEFESTTTSLGGIEFVVVADVSEVTRSVDKIRSVLWVTMPILVALAAVATWFLTGVALSPVRKMSRQVSVISGGNLHERVPVPGTADEIEELGATMNGMLDRLEADDQRLRQFISDASHELRSPVAVLRSEAEVALRSTDTTDPTELAQGVLDESLRLERIVADLLVLARGDEARAPAYVAAIDLDDIVLAEAARRRRVPVDASGVSAGRVHGSREGCERILVHLLDNAARHAESAVAVTLHTGDHSVTLTIDDDGPGIPAADRDRVFERFTRLEAARTRDTGGAGLGLAVTAATVSAMGGEVAISDSPLGGARFVVVWPAVI